MCHEGFGHQSDISITVRPATTAGAPGPKLHETTALRDTQAVTPAVRPSDSQRRWRSAGASRATPAGASRGRGTRRVGPPRVRKRQTAWPGWPGNPEPGTEPEMDSAGWLPLQRNRQPRTGNAAGRSFRKVAADGLRIRRPGSPPAHLSRNARLQLAVSTGIRPRP